MLELARIRAISLDLDDTLWPIGPAIEAAERALTAWLGQHAPMTAALFANPHARHDLRQQVLRAHPEWAHDLARVRLEAIRLGLAKAGEPLSLAEEGFAVFYAQRNRVQLFADARPTLEALARRFPLVALTNGNADLQRIGLAPLFAAHVTAVSVGVGKPDRRMFEAAAHALGVRVEEVLHVGDDAHLDVVGALGAGMQAVWVNRGEQVWSGAQRCPFAEVASLAELLDVLNLG